MMNPHTRYDPPDEELLERIRASDQLALSELYDRHSRLLYSIIAVIVRDTDEAEELLEEVFVRIWSTPGSSAAELGTPKTWMVRMAHNHAVDRLRSRRLQNLDTGTTMASSDATDSGSTGKNPDATPDTHPDSDIPDHPIAVLSALPLEERSLIDLAFLQGYTYSEIAKIAGISPESVRRVIRSGMMTLRSNLGIVSTDAGVRKGQ